jgi:hypothetical protein
MKNIVRGALFVPMWIAWLAGVLFECTARAFWVGRTEADDFANWLDK